MRIAFVSSLLLPLALWAGESATKPVIGYWGDGSGLHPQSDPPVRWDSDTGLNILWHSPTPTFGYGAPTALKDVVIAVTDVDSLNPWPQLIGYDLATGAGKMAPEAQPADRQHPRCGQSQGGGGPVDGHARLAR